MTCWALRAQLSERVGAKLNKDQISGNLRAEKRKSPLKFTPTSSHQELPFPQNEVRGEPFPSECALREHHLRQLPIGNQIRRHKDHNICFQQVLPSGGFWI